MYDVCVTDTVYAHHFLLHCLKSQLRLRPPYFHLFRLLFLDLRYFHQLLLLSLFVFFPVERRRCTQLSITCCNRKQEIVFIFVKKSHGESDWQTTSDEPNLIRTKILRWSTHFLLTVCSFFNFRVPFATCAYGSSSTFVAGIAIQINCN